MSTKVYNGYRLPADVRPDDLLPWAATLRARLEGQRQEALDAVLFRYARSALDYRLLGAAGLASPLPPDDQSTPWEAALFQAREGLAKLARQERVPALDVEVSAMVHFRPDRPNLYLRLFSESRDFQKDTVEHGRLRDFAYWDNSDEPEDIAYDSFRRRGKIWGKLAGYDKDRHPNAVNLLITLCAPPCEADLITTRLLDPAFEVPEAWHEGFEGRSYDRALGALRPDQMPQEVNDDLGRGSFSAYLKHERTLRKGENEEFNQHLARVRAVLPDQVNPAWFALDAQGIAALLAPPRRSPSP